MKELTASETMLFGTAALTEMFASCRAENRKALLTYLCGGYPTVDLTLELALAAVDSGADAVEIGLPFSDPLADGPVLQAAAQHALAGGTRTRDILNLVSHIKRRAAAPILIMTYYNPIFKYGIADFCRDGSSAGVDGLIVPDLPLEEAAELRETANGLGMALVPLFAPTSTADRIARAREGNPGFIYCVSSTGTTGGSLQDFREAEALGKDLRAATDTPLALGFGISSPEKAAAAPDVYDGVIVGSALARTISDACERGSDCISEASRFVWNLKRACAKA